MLHLILLASLAITPSTAASLGRFQPRMEAECCPCPAPGEGTTVTVTAPAVTVTEPAAAAETVYITQGGEGSDNPQETVTVQNPAAESPSIVYVTEGQTPESVTQYVTEEPAESQPSVQTVTVHAPQPSAETSQEVPSGNGVVTKTILPSDNEPTTVTVNIQPAHGTTVTLTQGGPSDGAEVPQDVTVTLPYSPPGQTPQQGTEDQVVTKTVGGKQDDPHTVVVGPSSDVETVIPDVHPTDTTKVPQYVTVTAAPNTDTASVLPSSDCFETLTKTVSTGGDININGDVNIDIDNVEITIININTGEQSCRKKHSGKPCDADSHSAIATPQPTEVPCPSGNVSTSFATVYNTIRITGAARVNLNATAKFSNAHPSGTGSAFDSVPEQKARGLFNFW